jgi:hypothetical protein
MKGDEIMKIQKFKRLVEGLEALREEHKNSKFK